MGGNAFPNYSLRFESAFQFDLVLQQTELSRGAHIDTWARQMFRLDVGRVAIWEGISSPGMVGGWSECCLQRSQVGVGAEGCGKGWSEAQWCQERAGTLDGPWTLSLVIALFSF